MLKGSKNWQVVADMAVEAEWQGGLESNEEEVIANGAVRVGVTDRMGKGHSVADQMEFEEEGVGPPSLWKSATTFFVIYIHEFNCVEL